MDNQNNEYVALIDLINILSFLIGVQNLSLNDKQVQQIEDHLAKQDAQYEKIINLLEQKTSVERR